MNENMPHFSYQVPRCVRMFLLEVFGEFINGFTNNLDIVNGCMKSQLVFFQLKFTEVLIYSSTLLMAERTSCKRDRSLSGSRIY